MNSPKKSEKYLTKGACLNNIFLTLIVCLVVSFVLLPAIFLPKAVMAEETSPSLEIIYPQLPGEAPPPSYVNVGLPEYVEYVFRFAVSIIGFVILAVLVYSGVKYLLSFGNPAKLTDARQGIFAAILGSLVLLGSFLIFNTINPQIVTITSPEIQPTKAYISPGVYICNKNIDVEGIIENYTSDDIEVREAAVKKLREEMGDPSATEACFLVNSSSIFQNFSIDSYSSDWTIFIVPTEKYDRQTDSFKWEYEYGAVLHERDTYGGECKIFSPPSETGGEQNIYSPIVNHHPQLSFTARAITLFKKPESEPAQEMAGVILYEGLAFNEIGQQKQDEESKLNTSPFALAATDPNLISHSFRSGPARDTYYVSTSEFNNIFASKGVRSIRFEPQGSFLAVLKGMNEDKCEVRSSNDTNLIDDPIGQCGQCNIWSKFNPYSWYKYRGKCYPCVNSLYVIKGEML